MKPSVYIETSVPSYYASRDSRDLIVLAHQQITRAWWDTRLPDFRAYVSPVVIEEAREGDPAEARKRLAVLGQFEILEANETVEVLAARYLAELHLPARAIRDAAHLAFACVYGLDFMVTWNCAHLANGEVIRHLTNFNALAAIATPTICTPEELLGTQEE
jgi:predicted nucleic acid-binding protein